MLPRHFVYLVVCGILGMSLAYGEGPERPACNADTVGKMWPLAANGNQELTRKLFHCGDLQFCTKGHWRYRWSALSVRVDQLEKNGQHPVACVALLDDLGQAERLQLAKVHPSKPIRPALATVAAPKPIIRHTPLLAP